MRWIKADWKQVVTIAAVELGLGILATWLFAQIAEPGPLRTVIVGLIWLAVIVMGGIYMIRTATLRSSVTVEPGDRQLLDRQLATADELSQTYLSNRRIRLADVPHQNGIIRDKVWEQCTIEGPAIVVLDGATMTGLMIHADDLEQVLWEKTTPTAVGAYKLKDVVLKGGDLLRIGFGGTPEMIEKIRSSLEAQDTSS